MRECKTSPEGDPSSSGGFLTARPVVYILVARTFISSDQWQIPRVLSTTAGGSVDGL